jgi:hypothetical protein
MPEERGLKPTVARNSQTKTVIPARPVISSDVSRARTIDKKIELITEQPPQEPIENTKQMTKFGKTIVGKILKGAAIVGGSVIGIGAIGKVAAGITGGSAAAAAARPLDKIAQSAIGLVTGTTKDERAQVKEVKAQAKAAADKLEQMDRLIKAGASPAQARAMAGVDEVELKTFEGKPITGAGIEPKTLMLIGAAAVALFILPKIFKR